MNLPDLSVFRLHKVIEDIDLEGVPVPGLRARFYRLEPETAGVYSYGGVELFMAWGYIGEEHCRYTSYRRPDGRWGAPVPGCPEVTVAAGRVTVGGVTLPAGRGATAAPVPV